METLLAGRRAIVSGGSAGLGFACAHALAKEGVDITLVARNEERLADAAERIRAETGRQVAYVAGDIADPEIRSATLDECPAPDILVNNAGGPPTGKFSNWTRDDWIKALDINMLSAIDVMKSVLPGMTDRRFGRIINITSGAVKAPIPMLGLSTSVRLGLTGFVASIARDYVRYNVTINNLLPGPFETDRFRATLEVSAREASMTFQDMRRSRLAAHPAGRFGRPEEFAAACVYLCSGLSGYVTAQNILLDGGQYPGVF